MAAGNRKSSNKRKTQTKKERMAEMEKAQAFRVEVTLWIVVAAALLLFISNLGFGGAVGKTVSGFLFGMFGLMAYVLPVLLLVGSFFCGIEPWKQAGSRKIDCGNCIFGLFMYIYGTSHEWKRPDPST